MTHSKTAQFLSDAIVRSGLTQREIARRAGFSRPNIISMMKQGETKVPIDRIPGLAAALGVSAFDFVRVAMEEYEPEVWEILTKTLGAPLTKNEEALLFALDVADPDEEIEFDQPATNLLLAIFEHLQLEARRKKGELAPIALAGEDADDD